VRTYWSCWLRATLRSVGFAVWAACGALLFLAGYYLDVLALDAPARRLPAMGVAAAEAVAWSAAIVRGAAPTLGEDLEQLLEPSRLGPNGTFLARWTGAWLTGVLACLPCLLIVVVLSQYIGHIDCLKQLIIALASAAAGGALLSAWVVGARPWLGSASAALLALAVWTLGPMVSTGPFPSLVPASAAVPSIERAGLVAGEALAAVGLALVGAALARGTFAGARGTARDAA